MAHPQSLVDAKCLGLSPVCCSLAGAVDGPWHPAPVVPYGYAIHRASQVKSIPVCACPVIGTQCKRMGSLLSWGGRSCNSLLAYFDIHMRKWEDCWSESCCGSKFKRENQKPWIVNTLRKWHSTERPRLQILQLPHTLSPEGHLLLVSRAAPGQSCSGFHEDNAGAVQLREEIN